MAASIAAIKVYPATASSSSIKYRAERVFSMPGHTDAMKNPIAAAIKNT